MKKYLSYEKLLKHYQVTGVVEPLISDTIHRIMTNRPPEPFADVLRKRLEIALRHPQPDQAQQSDVQAEINAAAEALTQ